MPALNISDTIDPSSWDSIIRSMEGTIFHSSVWADYISKESSAVTPKYITLLSNEGYILGAALGFEVSSLNRILSSFTRRLNFHAVPLVRNAGEGMINEFLRILDKHAKQDGYIELAIGSFSSKDITAQLEAQAFNISRRMEFMLRLDVSEDDLWQGLEYKRRKNIKKAERIGVTIHNLSADEGIAVLRHLQSESGQRVLQRGGPDITYKGKLLEDPIRVLIESGYGKILGAKVNESFVSAGLFTFFNNVVYHTLSGHNGNALKTQAPTYLLWAAIKQYRSEGAKIFNLGGCQIEAIDELSAEHGVYVYKKAFGAEISQCANGQKMYKRISSSLLNTIRTILRLKYFRAIGTHVTI